LKIQLPILFVFLLSFNIIVSGQEIQITTQQQLENLTDADQNETEDDAYLLEMEQFKRNPININTADVDELRLLRVLTDLQIENLLSYRKLFGKFISIYELQAVPVWDIATIKKVLPFISVATEVVIAEEAAKRFRDGEHSLLFRVSQVLEKSKGFDRSTSGTNYLGSPQRVLFRYRYSYKNLLQYGLVGDKDAGEQFFKGNQKSGFDFYSVHLFARKIGIIQALALGDFTVNMGQGLIQWQSLAFKKSADVMGIKRQSATLRPYGSAGEFYFNRGAGITLKKGKFETTVFGSVRKISANFVADTVNNEDFISSFLTMGYHRTIGENEDRNKLTQTSFGGNIIFRKPKWHVAFNGIAYRFSLPVQKRNEPYNLYAINGKNWSNLSVDYSYTHKNLHFFGEAAVDKKMNTAFVNGLLLSVDPRVDFSFLQRTINKAYQAVNGNAFTENAYPVNETGFYSGVSIRPKPAWRIDAYADIFKFPWLKYLVDAPSRGSDYLVQLYFNPNKQLEIYSRYRNETKQSNQQENTTVTNILVTIPKQSWRTQIGFKISNVITLRNRVEMLWYNNKGANPDRGFLSFFDVLYKPMLKPLAAILRIQYFETDSYDSRIYAYENDVIFSYSIPAFYDKGMRYYLNMNYDLNKKCSLWLRWAQTIYNNKETIGSGLDEISGNRKSDLKLQIRWVF